MTIHMQRDIEHLKGALLSFGARVEEALDNAVDAVRRRDIRLADAVVAGDDDLDRQEIEIEEDCLKILALYQPVAADLRFVVGVLKMNNDMERIGDLASNIAKRARQLADQPELAAPVDYAEMADLALSMVKRSLDALVTADPALARAVLADDDQLDEMRRLSQVHIMEQIRKTPQRVEALVALASVYRHLERIGDMATNVCEDIIYMVEGAIARHPAARPPGGD